MRMSPLNIRGSGSTAYGAQGIRLLSYTGYWPFRLMGRQYWRMAPITVIRNGRPTPDLQALGFKGM